MAPSTLPKKPPLSFFERVRNWYLNFRYVYIGTIMMTETGWESTTTVHKRFFIDEFISPLNTK